MYKKISNIAERELIEQEVGVRYRFPKLHTPTPVIDGSEESTISIITSENPDCISYGIWGILPDNYKEEWSDFQKVFNTLHITKDRLNSNGIFQEPYQKRRCVIIVTGFFIYHLYNGSLYPYYVHQSNKKPFYLAGIYNVLDDGFITCSIIMTKATGVIETIQNLDNTMPVIVHKTFLKTWLNPSTTKEDLDYILGSSKLSNLKAYPIAKEFFKNDISYDSMLSPVYYNGIPIP
ncbi:SOS response-associated peptidase [Aquimarina sp. SS2-1]|uniref:SOS response-associated peptidase n=1 Tax=Aquimarina besae TaxID=3342247 RepID=UPI00366CC9ED